MSAQSARSKAGKGYAPVDEIDRRLTPAEREDQTQRLVEDIRARRRARAAARRRPLTVAVFLAEDRDRYDGWTST